MNRNHLAGESSIESADGAPELPVHELVRAMNTKQKKRQYSLTMALEYILSHSIATKSQLRNHYHLDPKTMQKIEGGNILSKSAHPKYLKTFVCVLNQYRLFHLKLDNELTKVLADIMLLECGIKTDDELKSDFEEEKRRKFFKCIK